MRENPLFLPAKVTGKDGHHRRAAPHPPPPRAVDAGMVGGAAPPLPAGAKFAIPDFVAWRLNDSSRTNFRNLAFGHSVPGARCPAMALASPVGTPAHPDRRPRRPGAVPSPPSLKALHEHRSLARPGLSEHRPTRRVGRVSRSLATGCSQAGDDRATPTRRATWPSGLVGPRPRALGGRSILPFERSLFGAANRPGYPVVGGRAAWPRRGEQRTRNEPTRGVRADSGGPGRADAFYIVCRFWFGLDGNNSVY